MNTKPSQFIVMHVDDIVDYDPTLKIVRLLFHGQYYEATLINIGVEITPNPYMYSALWIRGHKMSPVDSNDPIGTNFTRQGSFAISVPKSLSIEAAQEGSILTPLTDKSSSSTFEQKSGSYFTGIYDQEGHSYGLFINPDGSILLKSKHSSITLGDNSIVVSSEGITFDGKTKDNLLFKKQEMNFLPSMTWLPLPENVIDLDLIDKIKRKFMKVLNIIK